MSDQVRFNEEIAEQIICGLMDGKSLVKVCEEEGMPHRRTVLRWMEKDEDFATRCARARVLQADLMDDKIEHEHGVTDQFGEFLQAVASSGKRIHDRG